LINECVNSKNELQCNSTDNIISGLWNDPDQDVKALLNFKGLYRDISENDEPDVEIVAKFLKNPLYAQMQFQKSFMKKKTENSCFCSEASERLDYRRSQNDGSEFKGSEEFRISSKSLRR
jgi:hypothetical protein